MTKNKIKFDLGRREVRNCWAIVIKTPFGSQYHQYYSIFFDNGSYNHYCRFDTKYRCFYGAI